MPGMKRALLIASPFGGLRGPLNDVETMATVLQQQNFEITRCCGDNATRGGILTAWERIIKVSYPEDVVVIYYAGHGGIVEDNTTNSGIDEDNGPSQHSWRYQFLVPVDFLPPDSDDLNADYSFNGILDVEIEHLLRLTTNRTQNVTTIFDCCHSGRMARDPSHVGAVPRNLPNVQYATISRQINVLRETAKLPVDEPLHSEGNPSAVRIAAASATETAWEDGDGERRAGAMTRELARALKDAWESDNGGNQVSWQKIMMRVKEQVNMRFPQQNPFVEGPSKRMLFSVEESETNGFVLTPDGGLGILKAGRVSGVREGNVYALMPLGSERVTDEGKIGEATVIEVNALESLAELSLLAGKARIPAQGVMAFLTKESLRKLPVAHPEGPKVLLNSINESKYLCSQKSQQHTDVLAKFERDEHGLNLLDDKGRLLLSQKVSDDDPQTWANASKALVKQAEQLARANHLLNLKCKQHEKLEHGLIVTFGTMKGREPDRIIPTDGRGVVMDGDKIYVSLRNNGHRTVRASAFDINVRGKISEVSSFDIPATRAYHIGAGRTIERPRGDGLKMSWPKDMDKDQPISESLVIILTDSAVDLTVLASDSGADGRGSAGDSSLEQLSFCLATGAKRDMACEDISEPLRFDVLKIPFEMKVAGTAQLSKGGFGTIHQGPEEADSCSRLILAKELPLSEEVIGACDLPPRSPYLDQAARGGFGAIYRTIKGIPPCVWVVNEHDEEIHVVVSKYRPSRMLTDGGANVSATGVALDFSCAVR
ncbi:hypothetical protein COL516b_010589 [Colletotrichum fioriniae]|nr:uncharacterized protein COL516b_010589 [Colletotrichum fioriniae]KAJ0297543.1 hypothetical protein COL516b_010589 [Colletotrichum fioriniae]